MFVNVFVAAFIRMFIRVSPCRIFVASKHRMSRLRIQEIYCDHVEVLLINDDNCYAIYDRFILRQIAEFAKANARDKESMKYQSFIIEYNSEADRITTIWWYDSTYRRSA